MIKGMTHNAEGVLNKITKYKGKISTGFSPGEGPNNTNHPVPSGFFRMLKEVTKNERIGASKKIVTVKAWVINDAVQTKLEESLNNKMPRRVEVVSLYQTPEEMWESSLAMYSSSDGLICKSHGEGTPAMFLDIGPNGERNRIKRTFGNVSTCPYKECPDFKDGKCKAMGLMKVFPVIDMASQPYRFETRSINTIIGVESSLQDIWSLLKAAHAVKQMEAGKILQFDGFFGARLYLIHRKVKSGGREVFITDLSATPDFTDEIMEPIKRGLAQKSKQAKMAGAAGSISLLGDASERLLALTAVENAETDVNGPVPLDTADEQGIAIQFGSDADEESVAAVETAESTDKSGESVDAAARKAAGEALLDGNKEK